MFGAADELRHSDVAVEAWWWWGRSLSDDGTLDSAWFVGLELAGRVVHYWAGLARRGAPYLYVEDLDGSSLRRGLEIKPPEMWAGHDCDVPFRQWSLGNEAHGVELDDPSTALTRPYGDPAPVTFDIEWFSDAEPEPVEHVVTGASGYRQSGGMDARIEVASGVLERTGPAERVHVWGVPYVPYDRPPGASTSNSAVSVPPTGPGSATLLLPYRRSDGRAVVQVAGPTGWWARTVSPGP